MLSRSEILRWLRADDPILLQELWDRADNIRKETVGDEVHLRGLIEFSNECTCQCTYCGLNATNFRITRYCLTEDEILSCAKIARDRGYGTIVLQSGCNPKVSAQWLGDVISQIKKSYNLAVTLSIGERSGPDLKYLKSKGADRYLLRFETSDLELYKELKLQRNLISHPRLQLLAKLRNLGYEIGGGIMIGLPGQTNDMLANDIELFQSLDLDMIGVGPYIPHPDTILGEYYFCHNHKNKTEVPNSALMTQTVIALSRLACPQSNIPATTALANISDSGFFLGLKSGANVIMPNLTPQPYRSYYTIYPTTDNHTINFNHASILRIIHELRRKPGHGRGNRLKYPVPG